MTAPTVLHSLEDREPPPRGGRRLSLDALVAGALILYPRYRDPVRGC
jgi:capsular polysaccharide export protein